MAYAHDYIGNRLFPRLSTQLKISWHGGPRGARKIATWYLRDLSLGGASIDFIGTEKTVPTAGTTLQLTFPLEWKPAKRLRIKATVLRLRRQTKSKRLTGLAVTFDNLTYKQQNRLVNIISQLAHDVLD